MKILKKKYKQYTEKFVLPESSTVDIIRRDPGYIISTNKIGKKSEIQDITEQKLNKQ